MKLCFYCENIKTFLYLCINLNCPLLLCFKKYWASFFIKISQKVYSRISGHKIRQKSWCPFSVDVALNWNFLQRASARSVEIVVESWKLKNQLTKFWNVLSSGWSTLTGTAAAMKSVDLATIKEADENENESSEIPASRGKTSRILNYSWKQQQRKPASSHLWSRPLQTSSLPQGSVVDKRTIKSETSMYISRDGS